MQKTRRLLAREKTTCKRFAFQVDSKGPYPSRLVNTYYHTISSRDSFFRMHYHETCEINFVTPSFCDVVFTVFNRKVSVKFSKCWVIYLHAVAYHSLLSFDEVLSEVRNNRMKYRKLWQFGFS